MVPINIIIGIQRTPLIMMFVIGKLTMQTMIRNAHGAQKLGKHYLKFSGK